MMWVVMRDGDSIAHRFYSENIDTAFKEARTYAHELGPNTNWVCTLFKNKDRFEYNSVEMKWKRNNKPDVGLNSNKKIQKFKDGHERKCLHRG